MRINKYLPVAFVYFFLNSLALPYGLTYTALLSPFLYIWVVASTRREMMWPFLLAITPMLLIHFALGVDANSYFVSLASLATVYIFCHAVYCLLQKCPDPESLFRQLLYVNFAFCIIAVPLFYTPYYDWLWTKQFLTTGVNDCKRLSLLTYEPSYYALLFTPLFLYYLLQLLFKQNTINAWLLLAMLFLPYVLSFSLGVISALLIAGMITGLVYYKTFFTNRRVLTLLLLTAIVAIAGLLCVIVFMPDNILFVRLANIAEGKDPSAKGRTFEAFWLAHQLLEQKSYWWGIGPGQIKILGFDLIRDYYGYGAETTKVAIPNAAAETLALFGYVGLTVRILVAWGLFFYTKVWTNYYRLLLFLFIFIYQFTGSFITNVAEYTVWVMAFGGRFEVFDRRESSIVNRESPSRNTS